MTWNCKTGLPLAIAPPLAWFPPSSFTDFLTFWFNASYHLWVGSLISHFLMTMGKVKAHSEWEPRGLACATTLLNLFGYVGGLIVYFLISSSVHGSCLLMRNLKIKILMLWETHWLVHKSCQNFGTFNSYLHYQLSIHHFEKYQVFSSERAISWTKIFYKLNSVTTSQHQEQNRIMIYNYGYFPAR